MIRLSGVVINREGQEGQVQVTLLGDDGTPMRYDYAGEVYASVNANSRGHLALYVTVTPSKQETVGRNLPKTRFDS